MTELQKQIFRQFETHGHTNKNALRNVTQYWYSPLKSLIVQGFVKPLKMVGCYELTHKGINAVAQMQHEREQVQ